MNRYLLAALYVMAGCAVTIPLKAQGNGEAFRGDRCRSVITNTIKVVAAHLDEENQVQDSCSLLFDDSRFAENETGTDIFSFLKAEPYHCGSLCRTSHKIRAPEKK